MEVMTVLALGTSLVSVLALFYGVIKWGLKLEGKIDQCLQEVASLKVDVDKGILPRADERIQSLEGRVTKIEDG